MDSIIIVALLVAAVYIFLYVRQMAPKKETFENEVGLGKSRPVYVEGAGSGDEYEKPYMRETNADGMFEEDFVYQNEGGPNPSKDAINAAKRRFPFDWANLPPSSSLFQAQQSLFVKDPVSTASPFVKETFEAIEAEKILPKDVDAEEQAEADMLVGYKSKTAKDMKTVDEHSVDELIQNIYGKKGLIAKVAKKANNVYEVYETMEKNPKIVYEDEVQASVQSNELNPMMYPDELIVRPMAVSDLDAGMKPWGNGMVTTSGRQALSDYNPNFDKLMGPRVAMQGW